MDVFSLLNFWRTTGAGGDVTASGDFDSSIDDEESFFDLVFTDENEYSYGRSPSFNGFSFCSRESNASFRFSSPDEVYTNNINDKANIFSFDSPNSKTPHSPLRLVMLGFRNDLKLEPEIEEVKIGALLKRDNSLRCKLMTEKLLETDQTPSKRFSKDVVNKYLNRMKAKVSKRSGEKSRLSEKSVTTPSSSPASSVFSPRKEEKRGGGGGGAVFREVRKRLGKSRSASAILQTPVTKNDDSALEQQDGIRDAILHCKRSYNSPAPDCVLSRSGSAPSNNQPRISIEELDI
ncbi:putative membrane-associated kinase regulator [Helianthus annuus]|uniref:Membrane-associated kinase regulator 2/5 n=1 Tax=Helianthus annuus TaxID=4232 RepID=A0A9K3I6L3_HELAN|nr:probable membrane-associated kinase regulator 5 [Helianthus annuus]KAF5790529.1 putative membrane-associated kinase regulator 2/5 [Helianthus annuus]KAJ0525739.1 putative membrane-associated kinase regulator [Helianthus annuus]KAJ0533974.1 putative membrane-associated kinase regulator [Helianthus annuus]KAJ0542125.1 putative membrane-associated kinase regulator [Helianthus annuus]KAJ0707184.1 putative membrane-associated kinase regulator [Helianthus annuus]